VHRGTKVSVILYLLSCFAAMRRGFSSGGIFRRSATVTDIPQPSPTVSTSMVYSGARCYLVYSICRVCGDLCQVVLYCSLSSWHGGTGRVRYVTITIPETIVSVILRCTVHCSLQFRYRTTPLFCLFPARDIYARIPPRPSNNIDHSVMRPTLGHPLT
jgi:hypothetical protein